MLLKCPAVKFLGEQRKVIPTQSHILHYVAWMERSKGRGHGSRQGKNKQSKQSKSEMWSK